MEKKTHYSSQNCTLIIQNDAFVSIKMISSLSFIFCQIIKSVYETLLQMYNIVHLYSGMKIMAYTYKMVVSVCMLPLFFKKSCLCKRVVGGSYGMVY